MGWGVGYDGNNMWNVGSVPLLAGCRIPGPAGSITPLQKFTLVLNVTPSQLRSKDCGDLTYPSDVQSLNVSARDMQRYPVNNVNNARAVERRLGRCFGIASGSGAHK